jgi:hypothetical protein
MARVQAGNGVSVQTPAGVRFVPKGVGGNVFGAAAEEHRALDMGLQAAGFEVAADFELRGAPVGAPSVSADAIPPAIVEVAVKPGERAVILVEAPGGVVAWSFPRRVEAVGLAAAGPSEQRLLFVVGPAAAPGPGLSIPGIKGSAVLDWLSRKLLGGLRTRVLKFVVGKAEDLAVEWVEGKTPGGLVSLSSEDPAHWTPAAAPRLNGGAPAKILLMSHGTFSTTRGSFGQMAANDDGRAFLDRARGNYDAVIGFDHRTLAKSPDQNAAEWLAALRGLNVPQGSTIDAIAYSRGGLVYRELAETLIGRERPDLKLGKAVFVGCTNGGTNLAEPDNWRNLVDLYTNIALAAARAATAVSGAAALSPIVTQVIETLGKLVQYLSVVAIADNKVPGLAGMEPDGALVTRLNAATGSPSPLADYYAITSNFVPKFDLKQGVTRELAQMLLDRVTNRLFTDDNDLVVDTASMTRFGERQAQLTEARTLPLGDGEDVYHTIYFAAPTVARQLSNWLF